MVLEEEQHIGAAASAEIGELPPASNSFERFLLQNQEELVGYSVVSREYRGTELAWRRAFVPILDTIDDSLKIMPHKTKKISARLRFFYTDYVFNGLDLRDVENNEKALAFLGMEPEFRGEDQSNSEYITRAQKRGQIDEHPGLVDVLAGYYRSTPQLGVLNEEWVGMVTPFSVEYKLAIYPIAIERQVSKKELIEKFKEYLLEDYGNIADMDGLLSDPKMGRFRELGLTFFKDLIADDTEVRKKRTEGAGFFNPIKEEWRRRHHEKFDEELFGRFWNREDSPHAIRESKEMLEFAVKLVMASRGEKVSADINSEQIAHAIGRVPLSDWPSQLRDAYTVYSSKEVNEQVERLRSLLVSIYPESSSRNGSNYRSGTEDEQIFPIRKRPKRKNNKTSGEKKPKDSSTYRTPENGDKKWKVALLRHLPTSGTNSHTAEIIDPSQLNDFYASLTDNSISDQMRLDILDILPRIVEDPYGPGSRVISGGYVSKSTVDRKTMRWRRFDPKGISELVFRDRESQRLRVVYLVGDDTIFIKGVYTHDQYDRFKQSKPI